MKIESATFVVDAVTCAATWTIPKHEGSRPLPAVFTAAGFAGIKEMLMPDYNRDLAERGILSLTFDYPGFGESAGRPRQQVDPPQQFRAFRAALDALTYNPLVDKSRIGVWGTSLSGGHALKMAATDSRVSAVAAVIPFIHLTPTSNTQLLPVIVKDTLYRLVGREGLTIPVAGQPGDIAAMNSDGAFEWAAEMAAGAATYRNEVTVASLPKMLRWSTRAPVANLRVPALVVLAETDSITPPQRVRKALASARQVEYRSYPESHFELFTEHGDAVRRDTVEWLANQLN